MFGSNTVLLKINNTANLSWVMYVALEDDMYTLTVLYIHCRCLHLCDCVK